MICVQFTDDKKIAITSVFACKQDDVIYQNQGEVDVTDKRYKSFYDALPDQIKSTMPTPEELQN